jgi:hypothetical protein
MNNIIRQLCLDIEVNGEESAGLAIQRMLPDLCENSIMPAMERILDRCVSSDAHLYFERLELDIDMVSFDRIESDLAALIGRALELSLPKFSASPDQILPASISKTVQLKTRQQSVDEAFVFFLKTGRLPWSFYLPTGQNFEQVLLEHWREATKPNFHYEINNTLRSLLKTYTARKRLIYQFSPEFWRVLAFKLSPSEQKTTDEVLIFLKNFDGLSADKQYFIRRMWETVFEMIANEQTLSAKFIARETVRTLPDAMSKKPAWIAWIETNQLGIADLGHAKLAIAQQQGMARKVIPEATDIDSPDWLEGVYVDCAGLVLLHPFLPQFFGALGIAKEDQLLQPNRALCLLHFLATGQIVAPEYDMVLPKILCNIPLETAVESEVLLTAEEQEEALALLKAAIHHWEALRDTSVDGLRGTFLVRPGKISLRDNEWLLQVETKAYDILLDQLPWGIGVIKLLWMDRMLRVEWNH